MSKLVELTEKDINYLMTLDLKFLKRMIMYFDYDLIMKNIEMTPKEINEMEDGYDYQVISQFDDLLFNDLVIIGFCYLISLLGCTGSNDDEMEYWEWATRHL